MADDRAMKRWHGITKLAITGLQKKHKGTRRYWDGALRRKLRDLDLSWRTVRYVEITAIAQTLTRDDYEAAVPKPKPLNKNGRWPKPKKEDAK